MYSSNSPSKNSQRKFPQTPSLRVERGVFEPLPEESKMANGQKLATPKQLAYIERLAADCETTVDKPLEELTVKDASEIIEDLLGKLNGGKSMKVKRDSWNTGARIGLAFKVCYQQWVRAEMNIFKNKEMFVKNVVDTYQLLNEIAEKAEAA